MCTIGHVESLLTPTQNMQKDLKQIIPGVPSYPLYEDVGNLWNITEES